MALVATASSATTHTGSVCSGSVIGTVNVGSNNFVSIAAIKMMVEDGTIIVPTHNNPPCIPPNNASHTFTPNTFANNYFYIEGKRIVLQGDSYSTDATSITSAGANTFFQVT